MDEKLTLRKQMGIPIYKQISLHFIKKIKDGEYTTKKRLPPERELAELLGVSRGTIKKAYEHLVASGYAVAEQGSGTYVKYIKNESSLSKVEGKMLINQMIDNLTNMGFDINEITSLFKVVLSGKKSNVKNINIAVVDCNMESLNIIGNQLKYINDINYMGFLLNEVLAYTYPKEIFDEFDLIFTTATHFNDLKGFVSLFEDKIIKAIMSTDRETIFKIAGIKDVSRVGVIAKSKRFTEIMRNNLDFHSINIPEENFLLSSAVTEVHFRQFIENKSVLILPPISAMGLTKELGEEIINFTRRGGEIITFNYVIERGSLIYIEEKISELMTCKQ